MRVQAIIGTIPPTPSIIHNGSKTTIVLPIQTVSEANCREHWTAKHRRKKAQQKAAVPVFLAAFNLSRPEPPLTITFTRVACAKMDSDNLAGSFKALRDALALVLGIDDGDERLTFRYEQRRIAQRQHWVEVTVERTEGAW